MTVPFSAAPDTQAERTTTVTATIAGEVPDPIFTEVEVVRNIP